MVDQAIVTAVLSQYPNADRMMAETLVMMHEQGKLMPLLRAGESEQAEGRPLAVSFFFLL